MKRSIIFYTDEEWNEDFYKGDNWISTGSFPRLYNNKEDIRLMNPKKWYKEKRSKEEFYKCFKRVKVTIEDVPLKGK